MIIKKFKKERNDQKMKFKKNLSLAIALALGLQTGAVVPNAFAEAATVKVGLVAEATNLSDWSNMYENVAAVSAVEDETGKSWTRLATDGSVFSWPQAIGAMKFDLGDKKIKFEDDKIIKIKTRFKAKTANGINGRMAMHYNLPTEKATALVNGEAKTETFQWGYNHMILWAVEAEGINGDSYPAYTNGVSGNAENPTNQTYLKWDGRSGAFNGEDVITVTMSLDKKNNTARFIFESDGKTTFDVQSDALGYGTDSEYLENIVIDNVVRPTEYIDVDYVKVWNLSKDDAADSEPETTGDDWKISDVNVSDNVNGVVSFAGAPENAQITVTKRGVDEDESASIPVTAFETSYNNGITTINFTEFAPNSQYTVKVTSVITRVFTFESKFNAATGLIATADTAADWSALNENGDVSEVVDADGTTWARLKLPEGKTYGWTGTVPQMKFDLGSKKIRFADDKIIRVETRLRAKGQSSSRAAMLYNMPASRVGAADGTEQAYTMGWNHSVLWQFYSSGSAPADFGYTQSIYNGQNNLKWAKGDVQAKMDGEDIVTVTMNLDKKANKAAFKYEYNGVSSKPISTDLGYGTLSDYLENIIIGDFVAQADFIDIDYVKVYNLEKSNVIDIDFRITNDINNIDDYVGLIYGGEMSSAELKDKFTVYDEGGALVYSSAALEEGVIKLTIAAPAGKYTVNIKNVGNFDIIKTTDTSDLADVGRPVIKNGAYDVDVVEDYVINYKTAETAANSVISVAGMNEGTDYTIVKDGTTATIEFAKALDYQKVYRVTIDTMEYFFKTATDGKTLFAEDFSMSNSLTRFNVEKLGVTDNMDFAQITADGKLMLKNAGGADLQGRGYRLVTKNSDDWSNYELSLKSKQTEADVQEAFYLREYYGIRRWANFSGCGNEFAAVHPKFDENGVVIGWIADDDLEGSWNQYHRPYISSEKMGNEYTLKASIVGNDIEYALYDGDTFIQHTNGLNELVPVNENGKYYAVADGKKNNGGVAFSTNFSTTPTYLDDIVITDLNLAFLAKDVKNNNGKFTIEFTMPVDEATLSAITVDGAESYKLLSADKKTVTVALKNAADGRYTVTVGNVKAADGTGVTRAKSFDITVKNAAANYIRIAKENGKAVVSTNLGEELANIGAKLYVAAYDADGRLADVKSVAAADKAEASVGAAATVKVFLWNSSNAPIDFE